MPPGWFEDVAEDELFGAELLVEDACKCLYSSWKYFKQTGDEKL